MRDKKYYAHIMRSGKNIFPTISHMPEIKVTPGMSLVTVIEADSILSAYNKGEKYCGRKGL